MSLTLDSEIAQVFASMGDVSVPELRKGDALGLREYTDGALGFLATLEPASPDVHTTNHRVPVDGGEILVRWYSKPGALAGPAVVYYHGGGMVCGSVELYDSLVKRYVQDTSIPFLSVDYRLSPEHPGTCLVEDGYAALTWFAERADDFGASQDRIAVMGDSGGGGVAAGVAIAARDGGTALARQILIYPMLDDRNVIPDPEIAAYATWTYDNNFTGWQALLGDDRGTASVSPLAAPARLEDFRGLAPAYIEVGELDVFRDESVDYARRLQLAGVSTELHVHRGVPHAFERLAPAAGVSRRSYADRLRAIEAV